MNFSQKIYILALLVFSLQKTVAQNAIVFEESNYETIIQKSKIAKKPVFYMIYATWCPHCNKMKKEVFTDKKVIDFFNSNFINAQQDGDSEHGKYLKEKFNVSSLPTFVFLDENGTILYKLKGEYSPEQLISEAKNALNPSMQLPYLEKQFSSDISDGNKCMAYLIALRKGNDRKTIAIPAHKYLNTQQESQLATNLNWMVIANGVTDIESREFQYVLNHKKDFETIVGTDQVQRKVLNIVTELLKPYTENLDTINYEKDRKIALEIDLPETNSLIFNYDLTIAERTENWKKYDEISQKYAEKLAWENTSQLKEIGATYEKHITDKNSLKKAGKWMERSLELSDSYDGLLLITKLYWKASDKKQANLYGKKAKAKSEELGFQSEESDLLFKQLGLK